MNKESIKKLLTVLISSFATIFVVVVVVYQFYSRTDSTINWIKPPRDRAEFLSTLLNDQISNKTYSSKKYLLKDIKIVLGKQKSLMDKFNRWSGYKSWRYYNALNEARSSRLVYLCFDEESLTCRLFFNYPAVGLPYIFYYDIKIIYDAATNKAQCKLLPVEIILTKEMLIKEQQERYF